VIRVVHVGKDAFDIYIGRACMEFSESVWHNPFHIEVGCGRNCVCDKYEAHVRNRPDLMSRLTELRGKTLGCWCKKKGGGGKRCHGDTLVKLVNEALGGES
jgi:Domain of unknown function (DUF4326)